MEGPSSSQYWHEGNRIRLRYRPLKLNRQVGNSWVRSHGPPMPYKIDAAPAPAWDVIVSKNYVYHRASDRDWCTGLRYHFVMPDTDVASMTPFCCVKFYHGYKRLLHELDAVTHGLSVCRNCFQTWFEIEASYSAIRQADVLYDNLRMQQAFCAIPREEISTPIPTFLLASD